MVTGNLFNRIYLVWIFLFNYLPAIIVYIPYTVEPWLTEPLYFKAYTLNGPNIEAIWYFVVNELRINAKEHKRNVIT